MRAIRILTVVDHYCPGWKAGGPIRAIQQLVAHLGDSFSFDIVASDRDLGDDLPYLGVPTGSWRDCGKARVLYLSPDARSLVGWRRLLEGAADYDVVYLNSLFSRSTIRILTLRRLGLLRDVPFLLAPRGELQPGALSLKPRRKTAWLAVSRALRLYEGIDWQAATALEHRDISQVLSRHNGRVHIAPDIPHLSATGGIQRRTAGTRAHKRPGRARVVFISRISRKKNLDYALRVLAGARGEVDFDIYGPIEDRRYWRECERLIGRLPAGVVASYCGALSPEDACRAFGDYDLFFFPTRGESYGHVVVESLSAGCPALISDQTPWRGLAESEAGWDLPLADQRSFTAAIERVICMSNAALRTWSFGAEQFASRKAPFSAAVDANRRLFLAVLDRGAAQRGS